MEMAKSSERIKMKEKCKIMRCRALGGSAEMFALALRGGVNSGLAPIFGTSCVAL